MYFDSIVNKVCVNVWCFQENSELSSAEYFPVSQDRRRTGHVVGGHDTSVALMFKVRDGETLVLGATVLQSIVLTLIKHLNKLVNRCV